MERAVRYSSARGKKSIHQHYNHICHVPQHGSSQLGADSQNGPGTSAADCRRQRAGKSAGTDTHSDTAWER
jgi:hypothetical protein